jgi:glycosyltransferase involved in cell wall biosynthesis
MGYIQNVLPKSLARLGADAHLVTMDRAPLSDLPDFHEIYGQFAEGFQLTPGMVERVNGFTLHVVGHRRILGYVRMRRMFETLRSIRADVVQSPAAIGWIPVDAAAGKTIFGYKLFTGCHTTSSVFPLAQSANPPWNAERLRALAFRGLHGRLVSWATEKCYAATIDCAAVATRFFGVQQRKVEVCPLGVDTEMFRPAQSGAEREERALLRRELGFGEGEIVCVYTGRFTEAKDPALLARAVERLRRQGLPFRGLFIGAGPQEPAIRACDGCVVRPFAPVSDLGRYFRAADVGVWPRQESMSMLDAAACGIPIVVNDTVQAVERIKGNGVTYRLGEIDDLLRVLTALQDAGERRRLGTCGAERMRTEFSWEIIARRRLRDYEAAVRLRVRT